MQTFIGFDSAWTDNPKAPGAICALQFEGDRLVAFHEPRLAGFSEALDFIRGLHRPDGLTIVGLDQPTLVPNPSGMRPAERVAASVMSWVGGGVQPANRTKVSMFGDAAPIWPFLRRLGATQDPETARMAQSGLFLMEVFPALAILAWNDGFCARGGAAKYNPAKRSRFRPEDWSSVSLTASSTARGLGCEAVALWCEGASSLAAPRKADQDRLDASLCALVALWWRRRPRSASVLIGDLTRGYMVSPINEVMRERLVSASLTLERQSHIAAPVV